MAQSTAADTVFGFEEDIAGAEGYFLGAITGVVVLLGAADTRFRRFRGMESIQCINPLVGKGVFYGFLTLTLGTVIAVVSQIVIVEVLSGLLGLIRQVSGFTPQVGAFLILADLEYRAYRGDPYRLSVLGGSARRLVDSTAVGNITQGEAGGQMLTGSMNHSSEEG